MTDNGTKLSRIFGTTSDPDISLHNFRPVESGKLVDPFEQPIFSNPASVGEKPRPVGTPEPGSTPSDKKI